MAKNWLTRKLFDWVFILLCKLMQGLLKIVGFMESFFDVFAGTARVMYKGGGDFLINIFFGHSSVTKAFWAMALIAIVMAFGFCIVAMARKVADVTDSVKQSVGQIFSNFIRCLVIILLINAMTVAAINITNVLLDRINDALENAANLDQPDKDKVFTDEEYAFMTRILATVANYSVNPSADSRYNINSCFNAIRNDLLALHVNGFFDYDYGLDENGHHTWQSALALLATSADLTVDLKLDTYYSDVAYAVQTVSREVSTYKDFAPVQTARISTDSAMDTDVLIFLLAGMEAAQNNMYNKNGSYDDALRRGYVTREKDYMSLKQVRRDFDIWEMDYLVAYIASIVFIIIMATCIFTFIVRMFNLILLYLVAPMFASSMPIDDGSKWQSWTQAFVIQLFSGFGSVIAMRLYLIIIPLMLSSDLVYFPGEGTGFAILNRMAQLMMVLGGAWAVLQASGVITGILAGNPGMAAIQQEGRIGGMVTHGAMSAVRSTKQIAGGVLKTPSNIAHLAKRFDKMREDRDHSKQVKTERAQRNATRKLNKADKTFEKADKRIEDGKYGRRTQQLMDRGGRQQRSADKASAKAGEMSAKYGLSERARKPSYTGFGGSGSSSGGGSASSGSSGGSSAGSGGGSGGSGGSSGFTGTPRTLGGSVGSGGAAGGGFTGTPRTVGGSAGGSSSTPPPPPRARSQAAPSAGGTAPTGGTAGDGFTGTPRRLGGSMPPPASGGFTGTPRNLGGSTPPPASGGSAGTSGTTGGGRPKFPPPPPPPPGGRPGSSAPPPRNKR